MLKKPYLLADLFQLYDMRIYKIFMQFKQKKTPTNLLEYRVLWDICNEFSLKESDFCTVAAPKAAARRQFVHVMSQLQQSLQVCKQLSNQNLHHV